MFERGSYFQTIDLCKLLANNLKANRELDIIIVVSWHKAYRNRQSWVASHCSYVSNYDKLESVLF